MFSLMLFSRRRFHVLTLYVVASMLSLPRCHFHVVTSMLSLSRCRFHVVTSTLSLPCCRFHVVTYTFSLPCCCFHVVASTLLLPRCRFHIVASTLSLVRCHYPGSIGISTNMADMFFLKTFVIFFISLLVGALCFFLDFLAALWQVFKSVIVIQ